MATEADSQFVAEELDELSPPASPPEPDVKPKPRKRRGPGRPRRGVCRECGEEAATPQGTYCAEHEPVKADRAPKARTPRSQSSKIETELRTNLEMLGTMWAVSDPTCGGAMVEAAPRIAAAWAAQAKANPRVARVVETVAGGGGLVGLVLAHAPLVMAVYAHHVIQPRAERAQAAVQGAENVPTGAVDLAPNGMPYVHRGGGEWAPARPDDIAAAAGKDLLSEAARHAGYGDTGGHGDENPAGSG